MRILVTGGAGFVGSHIAVRLANERPGAEIVAFDNLRRRGSELILERLRSAGVTFHHGDVRSTEDLREAGPFDVLIEGSAEPSVHAGYDGSPSYLIDTNLGGMVHCLEAARRHGAGLVFLSTSRVYPIDGLRGLPLERRGDRLVIPDRAEGPGWSVHGVSSEFPLDGPRSLYGTTKLCGELLALEYADMYDLDIVINRCGVIAGPWQMGKVDQGFVTLWAARHLWGDSLRYLGFGGEGLQVRDVLHVDDLCDLVSLQLGDLESHRGRVYPIGGGPANSTSLREMTSRCAARSREIPIASDPETRKADVPWFVTDLREIEDALGWAPRRDLDTLLDDLFEWLVDHRDQLLPILGP